MENTNKLSDVGSNINLALLSDKLDESLSKETKESLTEWLKNINNSCNEIRKSFLTVGEAIIRMKELGSQISKD